MNNPEYDGENSLDSENLSSPADTAAATASGADATGPDADDVATRAREQRKALDDEAIEGEHLDYFLDHVSDPNR